MGKEFQGFRKRVRETELAYPHNYELDLLIGDSLLDSGAYDVMLPSGKIYENCQINVVSTPPLNGSKFPYAQAHATTEKGLEFKLKTGLPDYPMFRLRPCD